MVVNIRSHLLLLLIVGAQSQLNIHTEEKKMSFKPPVLSEEEMRSWAIPEQLKCDSCLAVAYQIHSGFEEAHKHYASKPNHHLSESDILEVSETVCKPKRFDAYGITMKESMKIKPKRDGVEDEDDNETEQKPPEVEAKTHRLKGPGVLDEPGVAQMGGRTPYRLTEMCLQYMNNVEEVKIYQQWINGGKNALSLQQYLCRNPAEEKGMKMNLCYHNQHQPHDDLSLRSQMQMELPNKDEF